jgi:hypothetical protein
MTSPNLILAPAIEPLLAFRQYLNDEMNIRSGSIITTSGNPLTADVIPPSANPPTSYVLISRPGRSQATMFTADYLLRACVFDNDSVNAARNADIVHAIMMSANHRRISTDDGVLWITKATHQYGPAEFDDPDVPLFGYQMAVFWTVSLKIQ